MRSTEADGSTATVLQGKPWLQWLVVFATPMLFFFIDRLASLPALLDALISESKDRTAANQISGVALGLLEDLVVAVLLVVSLLTVDIASLLCSRLMLRTRAEAHFHTSMVLRGVGHVVRFAVAFTLVALALAPFALDMTLMHSQKTRFFSDYITNPKRDQLHSENSSNHDGDVGALCGVAIVSLAVALLFGWQMNLAHWWPTHKTETRQSEPLSTLSFSTPTYMDIRFEPYKIQRDDLEAGKINPSMEDEERHLNSRHTTVVSAPCELYGDDDDADTRPSLTRARAANCLAKLLDPWPRIVLVVGAGLGVFVLLVDITRSAAQQASPLVAGIALNASLNELVHNLFHIQFLPTEA